MLGERRDLILGFDLIETLYVLPGILIGFAFHEFAHAQTAVHLGDDTPRYQGRTTLNPLVHIDIFGFILILLAGFGWAKPVQINPNNFKNPQRDDVLVSLAGPLTNLLIALLFLLFMRLLLSLHFLLMEDTTFEILMNIFDYAVWINIVLFVFNLLPIPPLDGSHIFFGLSGLNRTSLYFQFYKWSPFILLALIITGIFDLIIGPPIVFIYSNLSKIFF